MPAVGPEDHVRGPASAAEVVVYIDLACPRCAAAWETISSLRLRICVRHFPVASQRSRAPALHAAAEAAAQLGGEDAFWSIWDSLLGDQAHNDDPHLWQRATALGLELEEFERVRRSDAVAERVRRDFRAGIRAGVIGTPSAFSAGREIRGGLSEQLAALAEAGRN